MPGCCSPSTASPAAAKPTMPAAASACPADDLAADSTSGADRPAPAAYRMYCLKFPWRRLKIYRCSEWVAAQSVLVYIPAKFCQASILWSW